MGCGSSSDPLLADIWSTFEEKYDFEQIFPSDPSQTGKNGKSSPYGTLNSKTISSNNDDQNDKNEYIKITDEEIDVNNNSSNLNELSDPYDILVDLNDKTSKLIIRLIQYNGNELQPIIKLGMNENKNSPQRQKIDNRDESEFDKDLIMKGNNRGLLNMELIISYFIGKSGLDVIRLCPQKFFPNDIKSMIISFYSFEHPKLNSFRVIIPTAILCKCTLNLCNYIGIMLSKKLLFQDKIRQSQNKQINQQSIISDENASICRQLIFLFHYILCLDQYKMPKQQPLTNNFTAYKRQHNDFVNKQNNFRGGGFASFKNKDDSKQNILTHNLTEKELLPIDSLTNVCSQNRLYCLFDYLYIFIFIFCKTDCNVYG